MYINIIYVNTNYYIDHITHVKSSPLIASSRPHSPFASCGELNVGSLLSVFQLLWLVVVVVVVVYWYVTVFWLYVFVLIVLLFMLICVSCGESNVLAQTGPVKSSLWIYDWNQVYASLHHNFSSIHRHVCLRVPPNAPTMFIHRHVISQACTDVCIY